MSDSLIGAVAVELTNNCQLSCPYCHSQKPKLYPPREKGFMDFDLYRSIVEELGYLSQTLRVGIGRRLQVALSFGGESMLHPRFREMIELYGKTIKKQNVTSVIFTNGILLDGYMDMLMGLGFKVHISLHKPLNPATAEAANKIGRRYPFAKIGGSVLEGEYTAEELLKVRRGVGKSIEIEVNPYMTETLEYPGKRPVEPCVDPYYYMAILWNGDTLPCCHILSTGGFSMGNIRGVGIHKTFNNNAFKSLRTNHVEGTPCGYCKLKDCVAVITK